MYNFIDVTEVSEGVILPSEALQINGEYIENQIESYRTLHVKGREALSPEVVTFTTGIRDGSRLKNKRYPERVITVTYQLITKSNEDFREAYNKLGSILNVEEAELIFNDEPDKFFVGTPCTIGPVNPGLNSVIGEFEILCADPFKYSVVVHEATPALDENSILIDYGGTYKSYPTLEADFHVNEEATSNSGDCGYVAFFNENEKIIQLGDPEEKNDANYAKSQTLINPYFTKTDAWNDVTETEWALNLGNVAENIKQEGSVGIVPASFEAVPSDVTNGTLLTIENTKVKPNIKYTVTAKTSDRENDRINVKVTVSAYVKGVTTTQTTSAIKAGMAFNVTSEGILLYKASDSTSPSGRLSTANWTAKKLYLWDASIKNNRIRVTTTKANVGKSGQVTGWVNFADTGLTASTKTTATTGLGKGYGLKAAIQFGSNSWKYVTLKDENISWKANATYIKTLDVTLKDLAADTTEIEDIKFKVERTDDKDDKIGIIEETECSQLEISTFFERSPATFCLGASSYGTSYIGWHGPSITRELPADAAGNIGTSDFALTFSPTFSPDEKKVGATQQGAMQAMLVTSDNKILAGVRLLKNDNSRTFKIIIYCDGYSATSTVDFNKIGGFSIIKSGSKIIFGTPCAQKTFDSAGKTMSKAQIAAAKVTKITFAFEQNGVQAPLTYNGLNWVKFVKNNCETYKDIPNKFSNNDVLEANCRTGEVLLNGVQAPYLGALGNDWEEFFLTPGLNQIGFSFSDWVEAGSEPTFKVRYREVFL